jgi:hypothetical protein
MMRMEIGGFFLFFASLSLCDFALGLLCSWRFTPSLPLRKDKNDDAAVRSPILAAFVSYRWRFPSLPPIFV